MRTNAHQRQQRSGGQSNQYGERRQHPQRPAKVLPQRVTSHHVAPPHVGVRPAPGRTQATPAATWPQRGTAAGVGGTQPEIPAEIRVRDAQAATLPIDVSGPIWSPRGDTIAFAAEVYPGTTPEETARRDKEREASKSKAQFLIAIADNDDKRSPNDKTTLKETFEKANLPRGDLSPRSNSFMVGLALLLACLGVADPLPEVDLVFRTPSLAGWEGSGFEVVTEDGQAASSASMRASSQNAGKDGRGLLHAAVKIPELLNRIRVVQAEHGHGVAHLGEFFGGLAADALRG